MQSPPADSVDAALARVFDRPEFAERQTSALLQLVLDFAAAFRHWLGSLLAGWLPEQWHPAFTWIIVGLLILLAVWAIHAVVKALTGTGAAGAVPELRAAVVSTRESADVWEAAARTAAAAGRFRDAAIALYVAALLRLDEHGVLRYHVGKTPGDYRAEVRSHPDSRNAFDTFIRQFLPLAFGARTPDAAAFQTLRASAAALGVNG